MAVEYVETSATVNSLSWSLGSDVVAAGVASALVSPIVSVIDGTIVLRAATSRPFFSCLISFITPLLKRPYTLFTKAPGRLVFGVYFGTYTTANIIDTFSAFYKGQPANTVSSSTAKFAGTATVSTGLTIYKDSRLAKIFGGRPASVRIPPLTYALFTARDAITIFASFNLPALLAPKLTTLPEPVKTQLGRSIQTESGRLKVAQFCAPAAIQFITTPIHLLGLDCYNRQERIGMGSRFSRVARDYSMAVPTRMIRIIPAFGVGGIVNTSTRNRLISLA